MTEHWITVKEAAKYCECKENSIVQQVVRESIIYKYVSGKGKGGKQLRILLESLSPEAQEKHLKTKSTPAPREASEIMLEKLPQDKRDSLDEKLLITQEFIKFRNGYLHKDHVKKFVKYMSAMRSVVKSYCTK